MNRLAQEKSPYLLQHAANPVDWYPWSPEAFEKAKREDKLVFLSIGYSTCHWCHVMEHESFEDPEVARLMNETFVSIKVDREERPDIDHLYMTVCQMMTGSGGWPLNVVLTPDKKPIVAGTYFPKENRYGHMGMLELVPHLAEAWKEHRKDLLKSAEEIMEALQKSAGDFSGSALDRATLDLAYRQLASRFDSLYGGFGEAPKFPTPHNLLFLLRYWKRTGEKQALEMAGKTLHAMREGGMYDHVGFGFHRYSTDREWKVPHYEKMLYDQALLTIAYIEAYQATGAEEYAQTAREVLTYILRDMTSPEGAFYSAEDADSEGEEGKFYRSADREKCVRPGRDDKILTDWNGLMIAAFAKAAQALNDPAYRDAASRAAEFILTSMREKDGSLLHRYREEAAGLPAHVDDYAFSIFGLLELYQATFEDRYLEAAFHLNAYLLAHFWDEQQGGFFLTADNAEKLLVRQKVIYDGATPSGNSVAAFNLLRLASLKGDLGLKEKALRIFQAFSRSVGSIPSAHAFLMMSLDFAEGPVYEVTISGDPRKEDTCQMLNALRRAFVPNKVVSLRASSDKATATVCYNSTCQAPTTDISQMLRLLKTLP